MLCNADPPRPNQVQTTRNARCTPFATHAGDPETPLAAAGVVVAALSEASFRMVGPIYGTQVGLEIGQIAYFLAAFVLGGALAQVPVGWLADKFDRRKVMIWLSVAAMVSCLVTILMRGYSTKCIFLTALFFGLKTFPIFSVATAHAHDFAEPNDALSCPSHLCSFMPSVPLPPPCWPQP